MSDKQYQRIVLAELKKVAALRKLQDEVEVRIDKSMQLIHATLNMLPDEQRVAISQQIAQDDKLQATRTASLTEAIRNILRAARSKWLTAAQVRDKLVASGFDFSGYRSNPLASITTTLRRLKAEPEIEVNTIDGVTAYRAETPQIQVMDGWMRLRDLATPDLSNYVKALKEATGPFKHGTTLGDVLKGIQDKDKRA